MNEDKQEGNTGGEELVADKRENVADVGIDKHEQDGETEQVFGMETEEQQGQGAGQTSGRGAGQARAISEEEARALLAADRMDVEREMAKADRSQKKVVKVVIIAVVVMLVLGVGAWLVSRMLQGEESEEQSRGQGRNVSTALALCEE